MILKNVPAAQMFSYSWNSRVSFTGNATRKNVPWMLIP